jgi:hypothetical protein
VGSDIQSVFYGSDYIGFVCKNTDTESDYIINVYDLNGKKKFSQGIDFSYDKVYAADDEIIVTGGTNCKIFRINGSVKFDGELDKKIISVVPDGKKLEYVVVYANSTDIIRLKPDSVSLDDTKNTEVEVATYTNAASDSLATDTDVQ